MTTVSCGASRTAGRSTPRADWQEWADILKAAGLPHLGVHAMRHSAATFALDEGVALAVVQEMLGHSDVRVTRGYSHVSSPLAEDPAARIGRALSGRLLRKLLRGGHDDRSSQQCSCWSGYEPPWGIEPQTYALRGGRKVSTAVR